MARTKAKVIRPLPAIRGALTELLRKQHTVKTSLASVKVRCRGCREFFSPAHVHIEGCIVCDHHTAFCEDCGGMERAAKGILYHAAWFSNHIGVEYDGKLHARAWKIYKRDKKREAVLKPRLRVLQGGKRH
ncbi:hypothetical protein DRQ25_15580 [Candidatus Fermentibacteria bacterium]|nr:MAG: hypothetical protein DRQ25_15580 [Candidatus Fermentibacteria bacterium]